MTLVQGASAVPDATALIRVLAMTNFKRRPRSLEYSGPRSRRLSTVNFRMTIAKRLGSSAISSATEKRRSANSGKRTKRIATIGSGLSREFVRASARNPRIHWSC